MRRLRFPETWKQWVREIRRLKRHGLLDDAGIHMPHWDSKAWLNSPWMRFRPIDERELVHRSVRTMAEVWLEEAIPVDEELTPTFIRPIEEIVDELLEDEFAWDHH